jgi:hypothetical protein
LQRVRDVARWDPATWHLHAQLLACIELAALQLELGQCEHRLLVRLLQSRREQVCARALRS